MERKHEENTPVLKIDKGYVIVTLDDMRIAIPVDEFRKLNFVCASDFDDVSITKKTAADILQVSPNLMHSACIDGSFPTLEDGSVCLADALLITGRELKRHRRLAKKGQLGKS